MSDKFEFKNRSNWFEIDQFPGIKNRPSLIQYKEVIIELSNTMNQLNRQNEVLKRQIKELQNKIKQQTIKVQEKQQYICLLKLDADNRNKVGNQRERIVNEIKNQNRRLEEEVKKLCEKCYQSQIKFNKEQQKRLYLQQINQHNLGKIKILQQNFTQVLQMNNMLKQQNNRKIQENQWQVKTLKKLTEDLRNKYKQIQINNITQQIRNNNKIDNKINENELINKKCFSTQKKIKRNIGFLSTNIQIKKKFQKYQFKSSSNCQNIKPFTMNFTNPQLGIELQNLKKQIAHQYTLMNLRNEKYSKQKVSKTLQQLKRKMGNAILAAQDSDNESVLSP